MSPHRVQRRRVADEPGMPPGSVYVGRAGRWGNPFRVVRTPGGDRWEVRHLPTADDPDDPDDPDRIVDHDTRAAALAAAVGAFAAALRAGRLLYTVDDVRERLAGRDLACWCPPGSPCHGDVLLAVANTTGEVPAWPPSTP